MTRSPVPRSAIAAAFALSCSLAACTSNGGEVSPTATTALPSTSTTVTPTTTPAETTTTVTTTTSVAPTTTSVAPTTTESAAPIQPALWPAANVVMTTPEAAATDFIDQVLAVPPVLGDFQAGDSRSGEIAVYSAGEGNSTLKVLRSTLLLRQLGPDNGWFVIGAANPNVAIETPSTGSVVPRASLVVSGKARGYEATILITARLAGQRTPLIDPVIAMGGSAETPEPYRAELDLTHARAGDVIIVMARGDTGLETDPGEFSAVPVVMAA